MDTLIENLRRVIGTPDFYVKLGSSTNYSWDYGAMIEYFGALVILCIVVSGIFRFLCKVVDR